MFQLQVLLFCLEIASSAIGLEIWAITVGVKKNKSIIKKKKKKHNKTVLLEKPKLNSIKVLNRFKY